jgi:hypothetical protein
MKLVPLLLAIGAGGCVLEGSDAVLQAPTPLFTGVQAVVADGDAAILAVVRDDAAGDARLIRYGVADHTTVELDRMPLGDGPQIMPGSPAIVWGFGGAGPAAGSFRAVEAEGARELAFGTQAPSFLLGQHQGVLIYASARDCRIESMDLANGAIDLRAAVSCLARWESVVRDDILGIWVRVTEDDDTAIGMIDGLWVAAPSIAKSGMDNAIGPFVSPGAYWFIEDYGGGARVYQGRTHEWPVPAPVAYADLGDATDAGALVDGQLWGAHHGAPSLLYPIDPSGAIRRYPISYQPRTMLGVAGRLIVLLADGTLLEQSTEPVIPL